MEEEKYGFVEEVIKKRPSGIKRIFSRLASWIGLAVVFSLGVVIMIYAMRDNLREILFKEDKNGYENGEKVSLSVSDQDVVLTGIDMVEIRDRINKSVVKIKQPNPVVGVEEIIGTGVILSMESDIYILTNYNKVKSYSGLLVEFCDGSVAEAVVWNGDVSMDVAAVKVSQHVISAETQETIRSASISNADWLENNFACVYEGNPFGSQVLSYEGKIAGLSRINGLYDIECRAIYTDIMMNNVNDGFLFDYNAGLTGIVISKISPNGNSSISMVALYDIYPLISHLVNRNDIGYLGINGEQVDYELKKYIDEEMPEGLFVLSVDHESAAFTAGIMNGDIITEIEGISIRSLDNVEEIILEKQPEDTISVTLMRKLGGQYKAMELKVELEKRKEG